MRMLRILAVVFALASASAAKAERVFDLDIEVRINAGGLRGDQSLIGVLTLHDDRTYTMVWDGDEFSGVWLQEKSSLQLFEDPQFTTAELIAVLEQDASSFAGFPVTLTSIKFKETARIDGSGDLKIRSQQTTTFRPGFGQTSPLKITWSSTVVGTLR